MYAPSQDWKWFVRKCCAKALQPREVIDRLVELWRLPNTLRPRLEQTEAKLNMVHVDLKHTMIESHQLRSILDLEKGLRALPPRHLQVRVVGGFDLNFAVSGWRLFDEMRAILSSVGVDILERKNILDFGCGCGRVIRAFLALMPDAKLAGTDIDPEAIAWLNETWGNQPEFKVNPPNPPSPFESDRFDFIYAISVFTHLPEEMQLGWLADLERILSPGGVVLITVHGIEQHFALNPTEQKILSEKGFHYQESCVPTTDGLPAFYQTAFHTKQYIETVWSRYFEILAIQENALDQHDVVVVQKRV